jgi:hypothetical protein
MWEYGLPYDGHNIMRLNCKLYGMEMFGDISRLKYHLAKSQGKKWGFSQHLPRKLSTLQINPFLQWVGEREKMEELKLELPNRSTRISGAGECQYSGSHSTMPIPSTSSPLFVPRSVPLGQPSIRSMVKTKKEEVDKIVAKCFLWSDIPFNIAKNPFYHSMFEATAIFGLGYRINSYNELRGPLLQGEKTDCTKRLDELSESWEIT